LHHLVFAEISRELAGYPSQYPFQATIIARDGAASQQANLRNAPEKWALLAGRRAMVRPLGSGSFAAIFGSLIGTSTTTSYIESAAGIAAGGRTGLTAVVVALCFLLALFFAPLAGMIPAYASAAALLYVACIMARGLAEIEWDDVTESAPAVIAAVTMPLTYSIATGIGLGFITYVLAKVFAGRFSQLSPAVIMLAALFALKFAVSG